MTLAVCFLILHIFGLFLFSILKLLIYLTIFFLLEKLNNLYASVNTIINTFHHDLLNKNERTHTEIDSQSNGGADDDDNDEEHSLLHNEEEASIATKPARRQHIASLDVIKDEEANEIYQRVSLQSQNKKGYIKRNWSDEETKLLKWAVITYTKQKDIMYHSLVSIS